MSQEAFADICELHRTYIGSIERAERNVSLDNIERIDNVTLAFAHFRAVFGINIAVIH